MESCIWSLVGREFDSGKCPHKKLSQVVAIYHGGSRSRSNSADGKGVPLVKKDVQKTPWFDKPERPGNRRMATLACVYSVDRYVRMPEQIVAALFRDDEGEKPKDRPRPQFKHVTARFPRRYEDADEVHESTGPIEAFCWARAIAPCWVIWHD